MDGHSYRPVPLRLQCESVPHPERREFGRGAEPKPRPGRRLTCRRGQLEPTTAGCLHCYPRHPPTDGLSGPLDSLTTSKAFRTADMVAITRRKRTPPHPASPPVQPFKSLFGPTPQRRHRYNIGPFTLRTITALTTSSRTQRRLLGALSSAPRHRSANGTVAPWLAEKGHPSPLPP